MTSKWDSQLTKENLQNQIKPAKEKWKELYWKVVEVSYYGKGGDIVVWLSDGNGRKRVERIFKDTTKCLKCLTEEEVAKVTLLGDRAIQWEELDIQLGLEKLLMFVQLREEWEDSLA